MDTIEFDDRLFRAGSSITLAGPSGSGKTTMVMEILKYRDSIFTETPVGTVYFYAEDQPAYNRQDLGHIRWHKGMPSYEQLEDYVNDFQGKFFLMVFDDLFAQMVQSDLAGDVATKLSHHRHFTCLSITQNIFAQGRSARAQALNSHYYILTRSTRDLRQISVLEGQMMPVGGA